MQAAVAVLAALALVIAFPLGLQAFRDRRADRELDAAFEDKFLKGMGEPK